VKMTALQASPAATPVRTPLRCSAES
jgi:hypothetical protein